MFVQTSPSTLYGSFVWAVLRAVNDLHFLKKSSTGQGARARNGKGYFLDPKESLGSSFSVTRKYIVYQYISERSQVDDSS